MSSTQDVNNSHFDFSLKTSSRSHLFDLIRHKTYPNIDKSKFPPINKNLFHFKKIDTNNIKLSPAKFKMKSNKFKKPVKGVKDLNYDLIMIPEVVLMRQQFLYQIKMSNNNTSKEELETLKKEMEHTETFIYNSDDDDSNYDLMDDGTEEIGIFNRMRLPICDPFKNLSKIEYTNPDTTTTKSENDEILVKDDGFQLVM